MSFAATLVVVLLAAFALVSLALSALVGAAWRAGLDRSLPSADSVLALRILPSAAGALLALTVVLPAFVIHEPVREPEGMGPVVVALALLAVFAMITGVGRALRARAAARTLFGPARPRAVERAVTVVDVEAPIVAVVGGWRPRIYAARRVVDACTPEEFHGVVAHEMAHVAARDHVKLLLLVSCPDPLAWTCCGTAIVRRWRSHAETEADTRAAGADPRKRVALASALVKVARLATGAACDPRPLCMPIADDDVAGRVRRLLAPPRPPAPTPRAIRGLLLGALLVPFAGAPLHAWVQDAIEVLVALGR